MVARLMPYTVVAFGLSDIGLVRQNNEDVWAQLPDRGFFVLADGMGGHQAGEVASREAVNALCRVMKKKLQAVNESTSLEDVSALLHRAIIHANAVVYKMSRSDYELRGMGTTLCCLLFHDQGLVFAHVGDSRIYRLRDEKLEQLTRDDSLLRDLVDQGQLSEEQTTEFLYKNIITKAIGTEAKVDPTVSIADIVLRDVYLVCSDGLSDLLTKREIEEILTSASSLQAAAEILVSSANSKGGRDNITVLVAEVIGKKNAQDLSR